MSFTEVFVIITIVLLFLLSIDIYRLHKKIRELEKDMYEEEQL